MNHSQQVNVFPHKFQRHAQVIVWRSDRSNLRSHGRRRENVLHLHRDEAVRRADAAVAARRAAALPRQVATSGGKIRASDWPLELTVFLRLAGFLLCYRVGGHVADAVPALLPLRDLRGPVRAGGEHGEEVGRGVD